VEYLSLSIADLAERLEVFLREHASTFFAAGSSLLGGALSFGFVIVISFYLAVQENGITTFLRIVTPLKHEAYVVGLWTRSQQKIGRWLQGQIILALLVGALVYLGLTILGVQYALVLALVSALFELIPYFGPIMAAIPGVALALVQSPILGLWVLLLYVLVQQLENHLIYPIVVRKTVGLPPLLVIIALLVGGKLGGFFGFVLAVPVMAALVEYLNDVVEQKRLREKEA
jgi:predicted PurR-regulated permease PerM